MLLFVMISQKVLSLLERGVGDYLSVDLWLERCMVGMQGMGTPAGAAESRQYNFHLSRNGQLLFLTGEYLRRQLWRVVFTVERARLYGMLTGRWKVLCSA